jgi:hypothetical protein
MNASADVALEHREMFESSTKLREILAVVGYGAGD